MRWRRRSTSIPGYPDDDRVADIRNGRRDGRKQLPTYSEVVELVNSNTDVVTPYCRTLITFGLNQIDQEYQSFLRAVDGHLLRRASLRADLVIAAQNDHRAQAGITVAAGELTPTDMEPKSPHEIVMSELQLRGRRVAMRDRRIASAEQEAARRTALRENCEKEIKETSEMIDKLFNQAQATARQLACHVQQRIAAYWHALVHTHSEGRNLASILPTTITFPLPAWVEAPCWVGDVAPSVREVAP